MLVNLEGITNDKRLMNRENLKDFIIKNFEHTSNHKVFRKKEHLIYCLELIDCKKVKAIITFTNNFTLLSKV